MVRAAIAICVLAVSAPPVLAPPAPPATAGDRERARVQLAGLSTRPEAPMAGYDRDLFPHWRDPDGNGCDAREDTLRRDGSGVRVVAATCRVTGGRWIDPYAGIRTTRPRSLDVDHVVPLAAAWRSGARAWSRERRIRFANDPLVLLAADASLNRQKGDKGPVTWLPPRASYRDDYAVRWIAIKSRYGLTVTRAERAVLTRLLRTPAR